MPTMQDRTLQCKWVKAPQGQRHRGRHHRLHFLLLSAVYWSWRQDGHIATVPLAGMVAAAPRVAQSCRNAKPAMQRKRARAPVLTRTITRQTEVEVTPKTQTREREVDVKPKEVKVFVSPEEELRHLSKTSWRRRLHQAFQKVVSFLL
mmetsp:Transcript_50291/g.92955  ORF Transcript_50291/g.92955 Transcript_50291/m.92955 type:complete len:148 (+) Transcript_50291:43-486(+)